MHHGSNFSGLILALLIGLGIAWVFKKGKAKFGGSANNKTLLGTAVVVALVLFLIFGASHTPHG